MTKPGLELKYLAADASAQPPQGTRSRITVYCERVDAAKSRLAKTQQHSPVLMLRGSAARGEVRTGASPRPTVSQLGKREMPPAPKRGDWGEDDKSP